MEYVDVTDLKPLSSIFSTPKKSPKKSLDSKMSNALKEVNVNSVTNIQGSSPPLKPAKRLRADDKEILRVKRKVGNAAKMGLPVQTRNPATMAKRNARERRRVQNINHTLDSLERILPEHYLDKKDKNKKLSKLEILRCTIDYINTLQHILSEDNKNNNVLLEAGLIPNFMYQNPMMDMNGLPPLLQQGDMLDLSAIGNTIFPPSTTVGDNQWLMPNQQTTSSIIHPQTTMVQQTPNMPMTSVYQQQSQFEQNLWNIL